MRCRATRGWRSGARDDHVFARLTSGSKGAGGRRAPLRCGSCVALRGHCTAMLGPGSRRRTRCVRCAHCAQTCCDKSVHEARCARGPQALRCSAPQRRCARRPPTALQGHRRFFGQRNGAAAGIEPAARRDARAAARAASRRLDARDSPSLTQRACGARKAVGGRPAAAPLRRRAAQWLVVGARSALRELTRRSLFERSRAQRTQRVLRRATRREQRSGRRPAGRSADEPQRSGRHAARALAPAPAAKERATQP